MFIIHYVPNRCETSIEFIVKIGVQPGEGGGGGLGGSKVWVRGGGQG